MDDRGPRPATSSAALTAIAPRAATKPKWALGKE